MTHNHSPLKLERFLPYRLSVLSNQASQAIAAEYQERFDLSMTEWRVMAVLARFPESSANAVARHTAMDKVAVSRALAGLVAAGRVDRHRDPEDRRRSVLTLTEAGWQIHNAVAPLAREQEQRMLAELSDGEIETLAEILDKLAPV